MKNSIETTETDFGHLRPSVAAIVSSSVIELFDEIIWQSTHFSYLIRSSIWSELVRWLNLKKFKFPTSWDSLIQ